MLGLFIYIYVYVCFVGLFCWVLNNESLFRRALLFGMSTVCVRALYLYIYIQIFCRSLLTSCTACLLFTWNAATQHNTLQHNTLQHNTLQHNTLQHNTLQHNTLQHNTLQHNTLYLECCNTTQYTATQHTATQHTATQHTATQHSLHGMLQHNTTHCNTTHCNTTLFTWNEPRLQRALSVYISMCACTNISMFSLYLWALYVNIFMSPVFWLYLYIYLCVPVQIFTSVYKHTYGVATRVGSFQ